MILGKLFPSLPLRAQPCPVASSINPHGAVGATFWVAMHGLYCTIRTTPFPTENSMPEEKTRITFNEQTIH